MKAFGDFDGLALFVRIVQAGGLAAAERATGIPKATLSRRLSALEETLNVRLARRTKKGVVLTEQGSNSSSGARPPSCWPSRPSPRFRMTASHCRARFACRFPLTSRPRFLPPL